ncbi:SusC/RagA family TonB-linked outer membrane protein [Dyadobacter psychrotolerans]|nr:SusC/RagA family TonB-linked outer membrane protein [Dyadobacter psychrotolerans]
MKSDLQTKSGGRGIRLSVHQLLIAALLSSSVYAKEAIIKDGSSSNVAVDISISGKVTDEENGETLPGVNVVVKGSTIGTTTDATGKYKINVPNKSATLIFSFVGYLRQEVAVADLQTIDVVLKPDNNALNEVVVTGFGDRAKRSLGYATTSVEGDDIRRTGAINPIAALQGMVPGLQVQPGIGGPQSSPRFLIRGSASLDQYRNQPLIVIDDIIMEQDVVQHNGGADQDFGNILKDINPDDIESINVLKGGAVTALYGSRANNGVILIKTKKGFSQKGLGVSVSHSTIWDKAYRTADFQNQFGVGAHTNDWITNAAGELAINTANYGYSFGPEMTGQMFRDITGELRANNPMPNNILDLFRTGVTNNSNVSVTGGSENGTFRMSYSRNDAKGVTPGNDFGRHSINFRATQRLLGKVLIDGNVTYVKSNSYNPANQGGAGIFRNFAYGGARNYDTNYWLNNYKDAVNGGSERNRDFSDLSNNVLFPLFEDKASKIDDNFRGSIDIKAPLFKGLEFQGTTSVNYIGSNYEKKTRGRDNGFANPGYSSSIRNVTVARYRANLNYNKIMGDFDVLLQGGGELNTSTSKEASYNTNGAILPDIYRLSNSRNPISLSEAPPRQTQLSSFFYQGSVAFRNYLTLNIYGRNDWNSTLVYNDGHGKYSYFYPGVDLAWVFTDSFKSSLPMAFDYGKLRMSYVISGNGTNAYTANTGAYRSNSPYIDANGNSVISYEYQSNTLPNQALEPERTTKFEAGLELKMFRNRVGADLTYYTQDTKNQIISFGVPNSSGVGNALINSGVVRNRGVEVQLYTSPVKTKNFSWTTFINYTRNRNTVVSLPFGLKYTSLGGGDGYEAVAKVGGEYGTIIAPYAYAKYQATAADGSPIDSPLNGKRVLIAGSASSTYFARATNYVQGLDKSPVVGSILPKFMGSWRNNFQYKAFAVNVMLDSKFGGKIFSTTTDLGQWLGNTKSTLFGRNTATGGLTYTNASGVEMTDGIIADGVYRQGTVITGLDGKTHDISGMTNQEAYDQGIVRPTRALAYYANGHSWGVGIREDAIFTSSWVSLQQVSIAYDLPKNIANKFLLNGLRASIVGNNLVYLYNSAKDKVNPMNLNSTGSGAMTESSGMPYIRSMGFTINGSF